jgi:type III restriction enzyme
MPRRSKQDPNQIKLFSVEDYLKTAPCVPLLRQQVGEWRENNYSGCTDITRELLHFWFQQEHRLSDGRRFEYHRSQRDAIETVIYIYEVAKVRTRIMLIEKFARNSGEIHLPPGDDDFARYAIKMATGSGKTKVMSLAIVWQYWNAIIGGNDRDYARNFLIIAPNVIVFERLKTDFAVGRIFRVDPLMPSHLRYLWDVHCIMRGENDNVYSNGALYLTNIQQLYEQLTKDNAEESDAMTAVLGPRPPSEQSKIPDFAT